MRQVQQAILVGVSVWAVYGMAQTVRKPSELSSAVTGFEKWTAVNKELYKVDKQVWLLCRPPSPVERATVDTPFHSGYIRVRVNDIGKEAMVSGKQFPVGTVIVKEKHPTEKSGLELCTIMRKREKGFNPECGDWEFGVLNKKGALTDQGKLAECMSCHQDRPNLDFTFRSYIAKK